jgi:hypothetical protein
MCVDERNGGKDADPRKDEKDQRDAKDPPFWCVQGHLTPDLGLRLYSYPENRKKANQIRPARRIAANLAKLPDLLRKD